MQGYTGPAIANVFLRDLTRPLVETCIFTVRQNRLSVALHHEAYAFVGLSAVQRNVHLKVLVLERLQLFDQLPNRLSPNNPLRLSAHRRPQLGITAWS